MRGRKIFSDLGVKIIDTTRKLNLNPTLLLFYLIIINIILIKQTIYFRFKKNRMMLF